MAIFKSLFVLGLFLYTPLGFSQNAVFPQIKKALPPELSDIRPGVTTQKEALKKLGKPGKKNHNHLFYELSGVRFDTTLGFKNGLVDFYYHKIPVGRLHLKDLKKWIPAKVLKDSYKRGVASSAHEVGRKFEISFEKDKFKIVVRKDKKETVESIYVWN